MWSQLGLIVFGIMVASATWVACATAPNKVASRQSCEEEAEKSFRLCSNAALNAAPGFQNPYTWQQKSPADVRDQPDLDRKDCQTGYLRRLNECSKLPDRIEKGDAGLAPTP